MAVIVKQFSVNTGEKIYFPGDSIPGLNKEQEQALVDAGHCRFPDVVVTEPKPLSPVKDELPEGLKDLGKGNFQLSDGKKVKGKAKAVEAQTKVNAANVNPDPDTEDELEDGKEGGGPKTDLPE